MGHSSDFSALRETDSGRAVPLRGPVRADNGCHYFGVANERRVRPWCEDGVFERVSFWEFVTGTHWKPVDGQYGRFGIIPLLCGTMMVAGIASLVSVPAGLGAAIYMSEYAGPREREFLKPILEILAGIPSVVFGFLR